MNGQNKNKKPISKSPARPPAKPASEPTAKATSKAIRKLITIEDLIPIMTDNVWTLDELITVKKPVVRMRRTRDYRHTWPHLTISTAQIITLFNRIYEMVECRFTVENFYRFADEKAIAKINVLQKRRMAEQDQERIDAGKDARLISPQMRPQIISTRIYRQDEYRCFATVSYRQKEREIIYLITLDQNFQRWYITDFIEISN